MNCLLWVFAVQHSLFTVRSHGVRSSSHSGPFTPSERARAVWRSPQIQEREDFPNESVVEDCNWLSFEDLSTSPVLELDARGVTGALRFMLKRGLQHTVLWRLLPALWLIRQCKDTAGPWALYNLQWGLHKRLQRWLKTTITPSAERSYPWHCSCSLIRWPKICRYEKYLSQYGDHLWTLVILCLKFLLYIFNMATREYLV